MRTQQITTLAELSGLVERHFTDDKATTVLYRGHGAISFRLIPKAGRYDPPKNSTSTTVNESLMLELFRRQSMDRITIATADDFELLALAQHHGLPTRLLDWTRNPLVALYFAVRSKYECNSNGVPLQEDAEIIAWRCPKIDLKKPMPKNPFRIRAVLRYVPRCVTPRLRAQDGLFTVHAKPREVFNPNDYGESYHLTVPKGKRRELKVSLHRHGIHEGILFPDLDGLARHIKWCQTDGH